MPAVARLFVHPLKSARGIELRAAEVDGLGFRHDRRWMVVDSAGRSLSQRERPRMALIEAEPFDGGLRLRAPGMDPLDVPAPDGGPRLRVALWDGEPVWTVAGGPDADAWLGAFLGIGCRLVHMPSGVVRKVDPARAPEGVRTTLTDGFPVHLFSEESLAELNRRLPGAVSARRFRPNVVVGGTEPHGEDRWRRLRIGEVEFRVVKPCARCSVPGVDPDTGTRGREPIRTLSGYRKRNGKVYFGQNLVHLGTGTVRVGDRVEVLEASG